ELVPKRDISTPKQAVSRLYTASNTHRISHSDVQIPTSERLSPQSDRTPNLPTRILRSLMAELSIIWLLLLGVILVLLSSGVLVANQWERFPASGQYSILWAYTLAFGLSALWAGARDRLRLTSRALQIVTLSLVPLNFIALDGFDLWHTPMGLGVLLLAILSLMGLTIGLYRIPSEQLASGSEKRPWLKHLLLSTVHLGWGFTAIPGLAVYIGVIGTTTLSLWQRETPFRQSSKGQRQPHSPQEKAEDLSIPKLSVNLNSILMMYGLGLLLIRAIFGHHMPVSQLGLAIGTCGFLIAWKQFRPELPEAAGKPQKTPEKTPETLGFQQLNLFSWEMAGLTLVLLGWAAAMPSFLWQALGVSILAVLLLGRRLLITWSRVDLTGLLLLGLQSVWLIWEMVPEPGQAHVQALGDALIGTQGKPWASMGLVFFPYLVGIVIFSDWLARHRKRDLAQFSGWIALWLGTVLVMLGALNPALRILSLAASTLLLALVTQRRWRQFVQVHRVELKAQLRMLATPQQGQLDSVIATRPIQQLGTLAHVSGLLTVVAMIIPLSQTLGLIGWSAVCLTIMLLEGAFSLGPTVNLDCPTEEGGLRKLLRGSAWSLCLIAAGLTYLGFWSDWLLAIDGQGIFVPAWGLMAGVVPAGLTIMAGLRPARRQTAAGLSLLFLLLWPPLVWGTSLPRLLSLGIATGLMGLNTRHLKIRLAAWISIGLGLTLVGTGLYEIIDISAETFALWLFASAIATLLLWVGRHQLAHHDTRLAAVYRHAADGWAFTLTGLTLAVSILWATVHGLTADPLSLIAVASALVLMSATTYRSSHLPHNPKVCWFSMMTILVGQLVMVWQMPGQATGLAWGVGLLFLHTRWLRQLPAAVTTVGLTLGLEASLLHQISPLEPTGSVLIAAVTTVPLWSLRQALTGRFRRHALLAGRSSQPHLTIKKTAHPTFQTTLSGDVKNPPLRVPENIGNLRKSTHALGLSPTGLFENLFSLYARACDFWAVILGTSVLVFLTYHAYFTLVDQRTAPPSIVLTVAILVGALFLRHWQNPGNWGVYAIGWSLELLVIESLSWVNHALVALAVANILLGIVTRLLGDWLHSHRHSPHLLSSWHILPLMYGALGAVLRTDFFSSWTGLNTFGLVIIAVGIGRRKTAFKPLIYLAIAGISSTAFELTFYQIRLLTTGDQFVAIAALSATMVYAYRMLAPWLADYLHLKSRELIAVAHIHWAIASGLLLGSLNYPLEQNSLLGLGVGIFLVRYAIKQGQRHPYLAWAELWVYLGGLEALGLAVHGVTLLLPPLLLQAMLPWVSALATGLAFIMCGLPWQQWGWPTRPWKVMSGFLPIAGIAVSYAAIAPVSLFIAAVFYGFLAWKYRQLRWRYLSILLIDWAVFTWLVQLNWVTPSALAYLGGLSILSTTWVDPGLKQVSAYRLRHYIRVLGTGIIGLVPLLTHQTTGLLPAGISLLVILAGLILRIRAFLYVGTTVFLLNAVYQLLILSFTYSLLKWIVGLIAGLAFIVIAANFETRRAQLSTLVSYWVDTLKDWE
ncbi:MAG: hypothetical protein AAFV72_21710, partial [Cyanobacteria bacterium J06635_1]